MQVNVAGIRRNIKNLAHNYSDAQVKVREATSNDPWGPSATIMAEIADLTYNVVAFSEIMQMIWKRLNDHGKNWRHVYKALIVLEYLIKTGTEKVAQQCKENIFAIQTLREFVYFEEGKDQGLHVREKAKQLVTLLRDDERLKNERTKALKAKERFAQHASGFGSDGYIEGATQVDSPPGWQSSEPKNVSEMEFVRPQTAGEEELQLQLAMAMSREEAEQEEAKRRSDDLRLQLALSQSEQDFKKQDKIEEKSKQSHLMDLLDISLGATIISSPTGDLNAPTDPWGIPPRAASQQSDPWSGTTSPQEKIWSSRPPIHIGAPAPSTPQLPANWNTQRTQSPSATSSSSNEGWLQNTTNNNGINGNANSTSNNTDPWRSKSTTKTENTWLGETKDVKNTTDPWRPSANNTPVPANDDPWIPTRPSPVGALTSPQSDSDDFDVITNRNKTGNEKSTNGSNNNLITDLDDMDPLTFKKPIKSPQSFLGENSALVNLDNLIKPIKGGNNIAYNPFNDGSTVQSSLCASPKTNLFQQQAPVVPSINQLKQQAFPLPINQDPWAPTNNTTTQQNNNNNNNNPLWNKPEALSSNPFLS